MKPNECWKRYDCYDYIVIALVIFFACITLYMMLSVHSIYSTGYTKEVFGEVISKKSDTGMMMLWTGSSPMYLPDDNYYVTIKINGIKVVLNNKRLFDSCDIGDNVSLMGRYNKENGLISVGYR